MRMQDNAGSPVILVVDDIEEVRDGLQSLLESDGYRVEVARSEKYAIDCAIRRPPGLVLINLAGSPEQVIAAARRIGNYAHLRSRVPMVLFCIEGLEGAEVHLGEGLYTTRPDNFNALRRLLQRLLYSGLAS
jgi:CheY-like chemotaxis protein